MKMVFYCVTWLMPPITSLLMMLSTKHILKQHARFTFGRSFESAVFGSKCKLIRYGNGREILWHQTELSVTKQMTDNNRLNDKYWKSHCMNNIDKKYPQLLVQCGSSARNILKFTSATFGIYNQENIRLLRKIEIKLVSNLQMALLKSRRTIFSLN